MTITIDQLHTLLKHDPAAGKLFWRERCVTLFADGRQTAQHNANTWNTRYSGREAIAATDGQGYKTGRIFGRQYLAHRLIWAMEYGKWPADYIDHINGVKGDNRIENLRAVTNQENQRNAKRASNNTSGVTGVCWRKREAKWSAQIQVSGRLRNLGTFTDFDEAVATRKAAEIKYNFHENHGRAVLAKGDE